MLRLHLSLAVFVLALTGAGPAQAQWQRCPLITQITLEECRTLEKLFFDTDGPNWINIRGWLRSNQPCEWYGITCVSEEWPRRVAKIDLSGNNLSGSLPGELSRLTQLRELRIDNSGPGLRFRKLTGTLPAVLGQLENLEVLQLGNNEFTGSIPIEYGNLTRLREFSLEDNNLTGPIPTSLEGLENLQRLDLSGNQLAGSIPDILGKLGSLEALDLSQNNFSGSLPAELGQLTALRSLDVSGNALTGTVPAPLADLEAMIWLSLADNDLSGPLPLATAQFASSVNTCSLTGNRLCIPDNPVYATLATDSVCGLPRESSCKVCSEPDCEALEEMFLHTNGSSWLNASGWLADTTPCDWFGLQCTDGRIEGINLANNSLKGRLPSALGQMDHLRQLILSDNSLTGELSDSLGLLTRLTKLDLSSNQLTGKVPLPVAALGSQAQTCDLSDNVGLCMPTQTDYLALAQDAICGLTLTPLCGQYPLVQVYGLKVQPLIESARLSWHVSGPADGLRFDIEQINDQSVEIIESIQGHSDESTTYTYVVANLSAGVHSFQLRQVSPTGASQLNGPVTLTLYDPGLSVEGPFPNPFTSRTQFTLVTGSEALVQVDVFDVTGRRIETLYRGRPSVHAPWKMQFGNPRLPAGTYFIRFMAGSSLVHTVQVQHIQ